MVQPPINEIWITEYFTSDETRIYRANFYDGISQHSLDAKSPELAHNALERWLRDQSLLPAEESTPLPE